MTETTKFRFKKSDVQLIVGSWAIFMFFAYIGLPLIYHYRFGGWP